MMRCICSCVLIRRLGWISNHVWKYYFRWSTSPLKFNRDEIFRSEVVRDFYGVGSEFLSFRTTNMGPGDHRFRGTKDALPRKEEILTTHVLMTPSNWVRMRAKFWRSISWRDADSYVCSYLPTIAMNPSPRSFWKVSKVNSFAGLIENIKILSNHLTSYALRS